MAWADEVQNPLRITTGDGVEYVPLWKNNCGIDIKYNIAQFDFPKIQGSKIDRGTPMAREFSMEIYFQGEDNIDLSKRFEVSARDPRPWNVSHPIYGKILVQPVSLKFDYSSFNITQISGTLLETLGSAGLKTSVDAKDKINSDKIALDEIIAIGFNAEMELLRSRRLTASDVIDRDYILASRQQSVLGAINTALYNIGKKAIKITEDAGTYLDRFNTASAAIQQGIGQAGYLMTTLQAVINFPSIMVTDLKTRVTLLKNQFDSLRASLGLITRQSDKINHESISGTLVSSMAVNAVTNTEEDFNTKADVIAQIVEIQEMYNTYLSDLDSLQTENAGEEGSYIPNFETINALDALINFTISNLYYIALTAKQERIIILEADSNVIILAHRFYGLDVDDSTIELLMKNNDIFLSEILQIRKGRTLSFYI